MKKKTFLILGIFLTALGVVALLFSGLFYFAFMNTMDASFSHYEMLERNMRYFFCMGIPGLFIGIILIVKSHKK